MLWSRVSRAELNQAAPNCGHTDRAVTSVRQVHFRSKSHGHSKSRAVAVLVAASFAALTVSACGTSGFRPLYATGTGVSERMAEVEVSRIPGRVGQRIRNQLRYETAGGAEPPPPAYRMEIAIRENLLSTLVEGTGNTQQQIYAIDATYRLVDIASKEVIVSGKGYARAPFERFDSVFANVRARRDAENRAADTLARDLKTQLEGFIATRPAVPGPA